MDVFFVRVEMFTPTGRPLYWGQMSRSGNGFRRGDVVTVRWKADRNRLENSPTGTDRPFAPDAGQYLARVTVSWGGCRSPQDPQVGRTAPVDIREDWFHVSGPAAPGPAVAGAVAEVKPSPPPPKAQPRIADVLAGHAPSTLRVTGLTVQEAVVGRGLSGRFVVRNDGQAYHAPPGVPPPAWAVFVLDDHRRLVFHATGVWGPGMRLGEEVEITWGTRANELPESKRIPFFLPRRGEYTVRVEVYNSQERTLALDYAILRVVATPAR
jgi:hypothetical protein